MAPLFTNRLPRRFRPRSVSLPGQHQRQRRPLRRSRQAKEPEYRLPRPSFRPPLSATFSPADQYSPGLPSRPSILWPRPSALSPSQLPRRKWPTTSYKGVNLGDWRPVLAFRLWIALQCGLPRLGQSRLYALRSLLPSSPPPGRRRLPDPEPSPCNDYMPGLVKPSRRPEIEGKGGVGGGRDVKIVEPETAACLT